MHELRDANEELEEFKRIADERGVSKVDLEKELIGLREQVNFLCILLGGDFTEFYFSGEFKASVA